ncbi:hypothetical protein [Dactylosporangium sp. CA-092794]|uniref:hypothetical protein n=1 Tax=Dactylosporangium sp. CA-092794 TaxID=3239929 RepID=UPI003D918633
MWQLFQRPDALRKALRGMYPADRAERMHADYQEAGPLTDPEVRQLSRLGPDDRDRALRVRYPSDDALAVAAVDYALRTRSGDDPGGPGYHHMIVPDEV